MEQLSFGVFDHIERTSGAPHLQALYQERLKLMEDYDRGGIFCFHVAQHHATPLGMAPSPNIFLSAAAEHTRRLHFGPLVYLLPFYQPLRLIEEICMLDHLSGGRLEVGVGRGVSPFELGLHRIPFYDARNIFQEALEVLHRGLSNERLSFSGKYFHFENVPMELRPLQSPNPPFWYGANNEAGGRWAAEHGVNVVYLGQTENVGRLTRLYREVRARGVDAAQNVNPHVSPTVGINRHFFVAETEREARAIGESAWRAYYNNTEKLWADNGTKWLAHTDDLEVAVKRGIAIVGSTASVRDQLAQHIEVTDPDYVVLAFAWGSLTAEQARRSFDLFVEKIMPDFVRR